VDDYETEISEVKKRLVAQQKEVSAAQKQISSVETNCFNSIDVKKYIAKNIGWCLTFVGVYI
jgi:hypothetical protein